MALHADPGPYVVPASILAEICYLAEQRLGVGALDTLLDDLQRGAFSLDFEPDDLGRVGELVQRYADLRLGGFSDAAVIACAERNGGPDLTFDHDLVVVAGEGTITVAPLNAT